MIPTTIHFIFLVKRLAGQDADPAPFLLHNYFCIRSCLETQPYAKVVIHTDGEITGPWWEKVRDDVEVRRRDFDHSIGDIPIQNYPCVADLGRAQILHQEGGLYADLDTLFIGSLEHWFHFDGVTVQQEGDVVISSIMSAPPKHHIVGEWLDNAGHILSEEWAHFASTALGKILNKYIPERRIEQIDRLDHAAWTKTGGRRFYYDHADLNGSRVVNLCQTHCAKTLHHFNEWRIFEYESAYTHLVRKYLSAPNFDDLTIIMPVSIEHQDRLENALILTTYLLDRLFMKNVIVVEYGERPSLGALLDDRIRYLFVKQRPEEVWNKARVFNTALPWLMTEYTALWDADVVVSLSQLQMLFTTLRGDKSIHAIIPGNRVLHVDRKHLRRMQDGQLDYLHIVENPDKNVVLEMPFKTAGGIFPVRTAVLKHVHGMTELYWGWGLEDDDLIIKISRIASGKILQCTGPVLHIVHYRTERSFPVKKYKDDSRVQRWRVSSLPENELRAFYGVTRDIGKVHDLAHPEEYSEQDLIEAIKREGPNPSGVNELPPKTIHFVFVTKPLADGSRPLDFMLFHYLCLVSCLETQPYANVVVHADGPIGGPWWPLVAGRVEVRKSGLDREVLGKPIRHFSEIAYLKRAQILMEEGGMYADIDTLFTSSLHSWFETSKLRVHIDAVNPEPNLISCRKGHPVVKEWLDRKSVLVEGEWGDFPCSAFWDSLNKCPDTWEALQLGRFGKVRDDEPARRLFAEYHPDALTGVAALSLYQGMNLMMGWPDRPYLKQLTYEFVRDVDTTFNCEVRKYLPTVNPLEKR